MFEVSAGLETDSQSKSESESEPESNSNTPDTTTDTLNTPDLAAEYPHHRQGSTPTDQAVDEPTGAPSAESRPLANRKLPITVAIELL